MPVQTVTITKRGAVSVVGNFTVCQKSEGCDCQLGGQNREVGQGES